MKFKKKKDDSLNSLQNNELSSEKIDKMFEFILEILPEITNKFSLRTTFSIFLPLREVSFYFLERSSSRVNSEKTL